MSTNISDALQSTYCVISIMGPHCGYSPEKIFERKMNDIKNIGYTFWSIKSHKAKPSVVQDLSTRAGEHAYVIFIDPSTPGGAKNTQVADTARQFSVNNKQWQRFDQRLCDVKVNTHGEAYAFRFDMIEILDKAHVEINLWDYVDYQTPKSAIRTGQGYSTVCAMKGDSSSYKDAMFSHMRNVVAIGRLVAPFSVWIK